VTDLSIFHVDYIEKCIKKRPELANEIRLAKAFIYASGYYGAESYIKGFSGYSIELLICYYKSFLNFVKGIAESKDKLVIDPEKQYKSRKEILESLNESKLMSPIVLVDPTFKERNALAALSEETLERFKKYCKSFLKNPKSGFFELKKIDEKSLKDKARKKKRDFVKIKATTNKQEGDIAGSKLLKFFNYLTRELEKYFDLNTCEFEYPGEQAAEYYFILKPKKIMLHIGPPLDKKQGVEAFKKKHKKTIVKKGRLYAEEKLNINLDKFLKKFKKDENKVMLDMGIIKLDLIT
jgi:tRNA CCA-adding enzyme